MIWRKEVTRKEFFDGMPKPLESHAIQLIILF